MEIAHLALVIPRPALPAAGEDLGQPLHRLALPRAHLVRMNLVTRGKLLGHADPETTLKYTHSSDDDALEAAETVGAILGNPGEPPHS